MPTNNVLRMKVSSWFCNVGQIKRRDVHRREERMVHLLLVRRDTKVGIDAHDSLLVLAKIA
jgi:hypothetical protein